MVGMTLPPPVLSKTDMYSRIVSGEFGNTLPRWFDWRAWVADPRGWLDTAHPLWGVQSTRFAADPRARLNVPRSEVYDYLASSGLLCDGYCISPMVTQYGRARWEGDVYDHPTEGLICSGNAAPEPGSWRTHMKSPRLWQRSAAYALLREVLTPSSFDDLMILRDLYPEHVYEFTALDVQFGTVPGRNAVVWEVRRY